MRDVRIEPKETGKGRTFRATCLATVEADGMWEGGNATTDDARPVWAMFAAPDQELRAFTANAILGRKILVGDRSSYRRKGDRIDFLKSAGYQYTWQKEPEGSIVTTFLPDLFRLDPGMVDPTGARFIILPPREWSEKQTIDTKPIVKHALKVDPLALEEDEIRKLVPVAFLFCAYLDRRTRCPLVSDGRFYLQVMLACLEQGLASWSSQDRPSHRSAFGVHARFGFLEIDTSQVGLGRGIAFSASHEVLEKTLAEQVKLFFSITRGH